MAMRSGRISRRGRMAIGLVATLALGVGACGPFGDDGPDQEASEGAPLDRLQVPDADDLESEDGCGEAGRTDPTDVSSGRPVARCPAGQPEPEPLARPATVRVGVRGRSEDVAPILLAEHFEEFAVENLTVEVDEYDSAADLFGALGRGEVDVVAGDMDGPFFDLVESGSGARVALGGPVAAVAHDTAVAQAGLWMRTDLLDPARDWADLEDVVMPIAVEDSVADAVAYPVDALLRQDDMSINTVRLTVEGGAAAATALAEGELSAAWLADPYWRAVQDTDLQIELVATLPVAESLGGVVFAERLLDRERDRDVGVAFSRAVVRTINTYLAGAYQDDDEVVSALAEVTDLDQEEIVDTPAWVFDWEIRSGTAGRVQEVLVDLGGVVYETPLPERQLVDRSLYVEVVWSR